tara:strand:- start:3769 stop:3990 length:222 start_codon:yes stop_codon:yes gene_type:complete
MFKKLKEMVMRKDARYELLEDRVRQLEDIIEELILDVNEDINDDDECIAILPSSIIEEMEKIVNDNINVIGIT